MGLYFEYFVKTIKMVLTTIYELAGYSLITAIFFMYFYMCAKKHGWKKAILIWLDKFKKDFQFRRVFIFVFYVIMILLKTLLIRQIWMNPLSNVLGGWGMYGSNGEFTGESVENLILFIPFTFLGAGCFSKKMSDGVSFVIIIKHSIVISFIFSMAIELSQLFFRLGTFQLADLFYNTMGGLVGGIIYWIAYRIKENHNKKRKHE